MLDTGHPSQFLCVCRASEFWPRYLLSQRRAPDRSKQCSAPTKRCSIWLQEIGHPGWTLQLKVLRPTHVNRSTYCTSSVLGAKNTSFSFCVCSTRTLPVESLQINKSQWGNQIQERSTCSIGSSTVQVLESDLPEKEKRSALKKLAGRSPYLRALAA